MTYFCDKCGFLFTRTGDANECPFCEGQSIRQATEEEAEHLRAKLKEEVAQRMRRNEAQEQPMAPSFRKCDGKIQ